MKKYALAAAVAAMTFAGTQAKADFQYNLIYNPGYTITGTTTGDMWTLQVKNDGTNGTGNNLSINGVTELSLNSNGTINKNGLFYIRTWNGTAYDATTPANNNQADFMNQGTAGRPGNALSYVNLGASGVGLSTPDENSQAFTDYQAVPWNSTVPNYASGTNGYGGNFDVATSPGGASGGSIPDSTFQTLAVAVVPHGQQVSFDMLLSSETNAGVTKVLAALPGDVNFDGAVNFNDLAKIAPNYLKTGAIGWAGGDLNGDGVVDFKDLAILAPHYLQSIIVPSSSASGTLSPAFAAVPEPATLSLFGLAAGGLVMRRRRV